MEIIKIYETASSDGYRSNGDGNFYLDKKTAQVIGKGRHGTYVSGPLKHDCVKVSGDEYLVLKSTKPIVLADSKKAMSEAKKTALDKLSNEEKEILGV